MNWCDSCQAWVICSLSPFSPHSLPRRRAAHAVLESLFCLSKVSVCEIFLWARGRGCHPQSSFLHPFNVFCWYVEDFHNFLRYLCTAFLWYQEYLALYLMAKTILKYSVFCFCASRSLTIRGQSEHAENKAVYVCPVSFYTFPCINLCWS